MMVWEFWAVCVNVVDGDTVDVLVVLRDDRQILATVAADLPDPPPPPWVLSDVTTDCGFRITEQRIVTLEANPEVPGYSVVERRIKRFEDRIRLYGVNTPERGEQGYLEAKVVLTAMLYDDILARPLICRTIKPRDKYGRWLATIEVVGAKPVHDVSAELIATGFGVPYFGGAR